MNQNKNILFRPYPFKMLDLNEIRFYIVIGIFVAFFLIVFQPFGISLWQTPFKILKLSGYGFASFLMPLILLFLRKLVINERKAEYHYKVWHEILWLMLVILFIALGCLIYSNMIGISVLSLKAFLISLSMVIPIGFFPVIGSIWIKYNRYLVLNQTEAHHIENEILTHKQEISSPDEKLVLFTENEKDNLTISSEALLYIESMDNYSQFVYSEDGKISKTLLRGALKYFETQINTDTIVRCHRSFIVNLQNAKHIDGNAQGYLLTMALGDFQVPVSRNFGPKIKAFFVK
jgi:hypothetical protein